MPEPAEAESPASEALPLPEAAEADTTATGPGAGAGEPPAGQSPADAGPPVRAVLAKLGLDGHDRGIKVVARMLRDAGMEVIYLGLRQTTDSIVAAAEQEDADVIGLSMHNAGHLTLGPAMLAALDEAGLDIPVVIGGIVPDQDLAELKRAGIAAVLGPGAPAEEVVAAVRRAASRP